MQVCVSPSSQTEPTLSWYDLSDEVKRLLIAAANTWEDTAQSQDYMQQALAIAGQSLDVLVAAYRYFFYQHNDAAALQVVATQVVEQIRQSEGLPADWERLAPLLNCRKEEPNIRLYLNAYAASGLLLARLGALEAAKEITARISAIDDRREFGATTVLHILTHPADEEDE
jgi:hypothetical protein